MAAQNTQTVKTMNALFKTRYADKVVDLVPEHEEIMRNIQFVSNSNKSGGYFVQPALLSRDHGVTFLGEDDAIINLEEPVVRISQQAQVRGSAMVMRSFMTLTAASRAVKGERAFVDGTRYIVESLVKSFTAVQEAVHWYGKRGYGTFTFTAGDTSIVVDEQEWAEALFIGAIGMPIDIYAADANGYPTGALIHTTSIQKVEMNDRKITPDAMGPLVNGTKYVILRKGAQGVESLGLHRIMDNQSGSLFGIDSSAYDLWRANKEVINGTLAFRDVSEGIARAQGRGLTGPLVGYIHPLVFQGLIPDYNALRETGTFKSRTMDEGETLSLVHGSKSIKFYVNSVEVDVKASNYVKRGYGYFINPESFMRVGSSSPTFNMPGLPEGEYWRMREDKNALELRMFSDEALFNVEPAQNILFTGLAT